ncbi:MAG TPA: hypothetical protein VMT52_19425 [Planctomycetota bacterium]|nr:hypothetical protein [Planctomycetota bacterium]
MRSAIVLSIAGAALFTPSSAQTPKAPVPSSPFLPIVYRYADTMLEKGLDTYGPKKTGLFLSALDRAKLAPLTGRPPAPAGVRENDRVGARGGALVGANPQHDQNLLRVLYTLSELSGAPKYREAADAELRWFLENAPSPATHLLPWGEHMSWDVLTDQPIAADGISDGTHELSRSWLLWDRSFDLAPAASARFALGLWEHQIADQKTGAFDRHAGYWRHSAHDGMDLPRHAGFYIRTWAAAHARTGDDEFLKAIDVLLSRYEKKRHPGTGRIPEEEGHPEAWVASTLSLAVDCDGAAHLVPDPLASRLRAFAAREDEVFCALPHDLKRAGGFVACIDVDTEKPCEARTPLWTGGVRGGTTAQVGLLCVSRYENTGKVAYRELLHAAADLYLGSLPAEDADAWPATFGHAISLELAAWRSTARQAYLDRARELANQAVEKLFGESPLPRASLKSDHYETITGADTLALALVELHLHILYITAVRCPPNTVDR